MSAYSTPPQPCLVVEQETEEHSTFATGAVTRPDTDAAVALVDVAVAPGSGQAWHTHPAPARVLSLEGDFAFRAGHGEQVQVVTVPAGASIQIPAELPHAYTTTGQQRGRLLIALPTDRAGISAQTGLPGHAANHESTPDAPPRAWRRVLVEQYHLAETRLLASRDPICSACGAAARMNRDMPYVRQQDAWFCADCWCRLSATEIEAAVQSVALRGVPLS